MTEQEAIGYVNNVFDEYFGDRCVSNTNKFAISQDMAIQALEKQIPKKVVHSHHCPSCDKGLPIKGITDDYCSECFKWNYCPSCGQSLDWSKVV